MARLIDSSILKFLLVGVGNTLLSMALMFLLEDLGYWPSTAIAYVAGAVMSFSQPLVYLQERGDPEALGGEIRGQCGGVLCARIRRGTARWRTDLGPHIPSHGLAG